MKPEEQEVQKRAPNANHGNCCPAHRREEISVFPVKGSGIHDHSANAIAVTAQPLGQNDHNGCSVPNRLG